MHVVSAVGADGSTQAGLCVTQEPEALCALLHAGPYVTGAWTAGVLIIV